MNIHYEKELTTNPIRGFAEVVDRNKAGLFTDTFIALHLLILRKQLFFKKFVGRFL